MKKSDGDVATCWAKLEPVCAKVEAFAAELERTADDGHGGRVVFHQNARLRRALSGDPWGELNAILLGIGVGVRGGSHCAEQVFVPQGRRVSPELVQLAERVLELMGPVANVMAWLGLTGGRVPVETIQGSVIQELRFGVSRVRVACGEDPVREPTSQDDADWCNGSVLEKHYHVDRKTLKRNALPGAKNPIESRKPGQQRQFRESQVRKRWPARVRSK